MTALFCFRIERRISKYQPWSFYVQRECLCGAKALVDFLRQRAAIEKTGSNYRILGPVTPFEPLEY